MMIDFDQALAYARAMRGRLIPDPEIELLLAQAIAGTVRQVWPELPADEQLRLWTQYRTLCGVIVLAPTNPDTVELLINPPALACDLRTRAPQIRPPFAPN